MRNYTAYMQHMCIYEELYSMCSQNVSVSWGFCKGVKHSLNFAIE